MAKFATAFIKYKYFSVHFYKYVYRLNLLKKNTEVVRTCSNNSGQLAPMKWHDLQGYSFGWANIPLLPLPYKLQALVSKKLCSHLTQCSILQMQTQAENKVKKQSTVINYANSALHIKSFYNIGTLCSNVVFNNAVLNNNKLRYFLWFYTSLILLLIYWKYKSTAGSLSTIQILNCKQPWVTLLQFLAFYSMVKFCHVWQWRIHLKMCSKKIVQALIKWPHKNLKIGFLLSILKLLKVI
jgi:hypothetical protein